MYKKQENLQSKIGDFNQPLGVKLNLENRWVKLAQMIPWDEYEKKYSSLFKSNTGNVAKPFRMALGARIIQIKFGYSDRELVEEIKENPYLQYFIGLDKFQYEAPFDPSLMVVFRKRIDLDVSKFLNESFLKEYEKEADGDNNHKGGTGTSGDSSEGCDKTEEANNGTLILDATCAPSNIRFPQDYSLLNEAREKLEKIIKRICKDNNEHMPRTYCRVARKDHLNLAKSKKRTVKKIRKTIKKEFGYIKRDLGYIAEYKQKGYIFIPRETALIETIKKIYEQQKEMYDNHTHRVEDRIVSITQPYIRPIVRGKAKTPVEFGAKFDLSIDEYGMGRIETISFNPYNESQFLQTAIENYKERTGHYPERVLVDQIYRNRNNRQYCKARGIRISGPKLGRPQTNITRKEKKLEYQDNTDRIEVERSFSLSKRCYGLGLIKCKTEKTTYSDIGMSIFVTNLFRILNRLGESRPLFLAILKLIFIGIFQAFKLNEFHQLQAA